MKLSVLVAIIILGVFAGTAGVAHVAAQTPSDATTEPQQLEPTEVPAATEEPAAEEPTEAPVATDVPVDEGEVSEPTGEATEEGTGDEGDDDNTQTWLIVGLIIGAIILLIGIGGALFGRRGSDSKSGPATGWDAHAGDAYGKAAALHDAIAVELASTTPLTDDASARQRWQDIQRRIDDLTADLHVLETQPKNEQAAATLRQMFATLTALRASMITTGPGQPPAPGQPSAAEQLQASIRQRLQEFDGDVRAFRTLL